MSKSGCCFPFCFCFYSMYCHRDCSLVMQRNAVYKLIIAHRLCIHIGYYPTINRLNTETIFHSTMMTDTKKFNWFVCFFVCLFVVHHFIVSVNYHQNVFFLALVRVGWPFLYFATFLCVDKSIEMIKIICIHTIMTVAKKLTIELVHVN